MDYTRSGQRYDRIFDVAAYRSVFESKRALRPKGVYVMVPATIAGTFQAIVLGGLISIAGSRKMGMLAWKPMQQDDVAFLIGAHRSRQAGRRSSTDATR